MTSCVISQLKNSQHIVWWIRMTLLRKLATMAASSPLVQRPRLLLVLTILLTGIQSARAGNDRNCDTYRPSTPQGQCGRSLADLLSVVCISYNGRGKRSIDDDPSTVGSENNLVDNPDIFLPKDKAMAILERGKRGLHGRSRITCECCWYRCNYRELTQYCREIDTSLYAKRAVSSALDGGHRDQKHMNSLTERGRQDLLEKQAIGREILRHDVSWMDPFDPRAGGRYAHFHVHTHAAPRDTSHDQEDFSNSISDDPPVD